MTPFFSLTRLTCKVKGHDYSLNITVQPRETKVITCVRCKYPVFWCCNHYNPETKEGKMEYKYYK